MPPHTSSAETSEAFWERRYTMMSQPSNGRVSAALQRYAAGRQSRRALELGCGRGDDAIWLAQRGWTVTGADVSETALRAARGAAEAAGVQNRARFVRHDLNETFPDGTYELVTAMFLHSPVAFGRPMVLRQAAKSVAPGGLLLIAAHGSRAPWSQTPVDMVYPTAQDEIANLSLESGAWREIFVGPLQRDATGPDGSHAVVTDLIVAVERVGRLQYGVSLS